MKNYVNIKLGRIPKVAEATSAVQNGEVHFSAQFGQI